MSTWNSSVNHKDCEVVIMNTTFNEMIDDNKMVECFYKDSVIRIPKKLLRAMTLRLQFDNRKFVRYKEGAQIYGMSEREFMRLSHEANAVYKRNRLVLVNVDVLDKYMELLKK